MKKAPGRLGAVVLAFSLLLGPLGAIPASAQSSSETGIIQITVKDAAAQQALADDSDPARPKVVEGPFSRSNDRSSNQGR